VEPNFAFNEARVARFRAYVADHGWTPASLAIAWTLHRGDHVIPIPGTRSAEHLADDAAGAAIELTEAHMAEIEEILPVGFAHGDRYNEKQYIGPERYC
jgi:aryl-alcohol dehydrogenase-like predicted oxidoreductase